MYFVRLAKNLKTSVKVQVAATATATAFTVYNTSILYTIMTYSESLSSIIYMQILKNCRSLWGKDFRNSAKNSNS